MPQQAWIQNMTLHDNVLFGSPYNEEKYKQTIYACALEPDLKQLLAGDQVPSSPSLPPFFSVFKEEMALLESITRLALS